MQKSKRAAYAVLIALTIPLGLATRSATLPMPGVVRDYGGDLLSATCIFFGVRFSLPRLTLMICTFIGYLACLLIELQQLITWTPLRKLRDETPADILLGHGFLWSDLVCYAVGVGIGAAVGWFVETRIATEAAVR